MVLAPTLCMRLSSLLVYLPVLSSDSTLSFTLSLKRLIVCSFFNVKILFCVSFFQDDTTKHPLHIAAHLQGALSRHTQANLTKELQYPAHGKKSLNSNIQPKKRNRRQAVTLLLIFSLLPIIPLHPSFQLRNSSIRLVPNFYSCSPLL